MKLFLLLLTLSTSYSIPPSHLYANNRIVGGNATDIEEIPYIGSLRYSGVHSCGCIILNQDYVLTAAHCTADVHPNQLMIRFGSSYHAHLGTLRSIRVIIEHPNYTPRNLDFDFSILQLMTPLMFGIGIQPILLPNQHEEFADGLLMVTSGWGVTQNPNESRSRLRKVKVPIFNQRKCEIAYSSINPVTDRMICAGFEEGGRDACQGDSGGPLAYDRKNSDGSVTPILVGVTSWGRGCALPNYPGVYSRVPYVVEWIKLTVGIP